MSSRDPATRTAARIALLSALLMLALVALPLLAAGLLS